MLISPRNYQSILEGAKDALGLPLQEAAAAWGMESYDARVLASHYLRLANTALADGENYMAYDAARRGEHVLRTSVPAAVQQPLGRTLRHKQAVALSRAGATEKAEAVLHALEKEDASDPEVQGGLARLQRDRAQQALTPRERLACWKKSYQISLSIFQKKPHFYNAGQAANAALMMGDPARAGQHARQAREIVMRERREKRSQLSPEDHFWHEATLAEAALVLGQQARARQHYESVRELAQGKRSGDLGACLRVARMLLLQLGLPATTFDDCFQLPPIGLFSGHLFDASGSPSPRLPVSAAPRIQQQIRAHLQKQQISMAYCGMSWGADLLFAEALLDQQGARLHLVLPADPDTTRKYCIARPTPQDQRRDWNQRFQKVLERAATVRALPLQGLLPSDEDFAYLNDLIVGLALSKAAELDRHLAPLVVWNGVDNPEKGGTAGFIRLCRREPRTKVTIIHAKA